MQTACPTSPLIFLPHTIPLWNYLPASVAEVSFFGIFQEGADPAILLKMLRVHLPSKSSRWGSLLYGINTLCRHGRQIGLCMTCQKQVWKLSSFYLFIIAAFNFDYHIYSYNIHILIIVICISSSCLISLMFHLSQGWSQRGCLRGGGGGGGGGALKA